MTRVFSSSFSSFLVMMLSLMISDRLAAQTTRQQTWLSASVAERVKLAEALGESGARQHAREQGLEPLLDGNAKSLPQGLDQVYLSRDKIVVVEAKGGTSPLGRAYGHAQGSPEWAVHGAARMIKSPSASPTEKAAAQAVLENAARGQLEVRVIRTPHVLGEPTTPVVEQSLSATSESTRLAREHLAQQVQKAPATVTIGQRAAESADDVGRAASKSGSVVRTAAKGAAVVGAAVDAGLRVQSGIETERQFASGRLTAQQRETAHARNAAGFAGGCGGAWAGAKLGAAGGGAVGTACGGVGAPIGAVAGAVGGGVAGYYGGEAAAEAIADKSMRAVHQTGTTVSKSGRSIWRRVWGE